LSKATITEYAEAMTAGANFPPVTVFHDGEAFWLGDGFHRVHASLAIGRKKIACEIREGSRREAILFSASCNATHGLRRTTADKWHAVQLLLSDKEWAAASDRWIAEKAGVGHPFVAKVRAQLELDSSSPGAAAVSQLESDSSSPAARLGKDGKARKLPKAKPSEPAYVAIPAGAPSMTIALAPADEASALAELQSDIERHLLAWTWRTDPFVEALTSSAQRAKRELASRPANGKAL
jgi:hypothetical protein